MHQDPRAFSAELLPNSWHQACLVAGITTNQGRAFVLAEPHEVYISLVLQPVQVPLTAALPSQLGSPPPGVTCKLAKSTLHLIMQTISEGVEWCWSQH